MSPKIGEPYAYEVSMEDKLGMAGDPDTRPARQPLDLVDRLLARGDADSVEAVEAIREWRDLYESAKADAALVAPALTADEHREWLKACHCAEPAPLVPGAKCRKCHRWTVAAVNERTGEMTVIPSNQSEVAIDAAREPQLKQYRPGVGEPMYTDMMNHPYVVPYYLASEVDALVAELRQDLEAAQTQCASAERALNAAYNEADGVLAGLRALIAQMEQIQTYETQEVETLHGLNGHEDWMRSDVVQAGLRKLGELLVPGRPARSQEKTVPMGLR